MAKLCTVCVKFVEKFQFAAIYARLTCFACLFASLYKLSRQVGEWGGGNAFKMHLKPHKRKRTLIGTHSRASFLLHEFKFRICLDTIRTKADSALSCNTRYVATQFQGVDKTAKKKARWANFFRCTSRKWSRALSRSAVRERGVEVEG